MIRARGAEKWGEVNYTWPVTAAFSVFAETHYTTHSSRLLYFAYASHTILPVSWKAVQRGEFAQVVVVISSLLQVKRLPKTIR